MHSFFFAAPFYLRTKKYLSEGEPAAGSISFSYTYLQELSFSQIPWRESIMNYVAVRNHFLLPIIRICSKAQKTLFLIRKKNHLLKLIIIVHNLSGCHSVFLKRKSGHIKISLHSSFVFFYVFSGDMCERGSCFSLLFCVTKAAAQVCMTKIARKRLNLGTILGSNWCQL